MLTAQTLSPPTEAPIIEIDAPSSVDAQFVERCVAEHGFAIIRGLVARDRLNTARRAIAVGFDPRQDAPATGTPPDAALRNFQKIVIGGGAQRGYYVPRFARILYNPLWAEDIYKMREIFRILARLRNRLQGYPETYAMDQVEDGLFTAARLQHYPAGGGFFAAHRDAVVDRVTREAGLAKFFQLVMLLTQKGEDFAAGGAFVDRNGARLDLEAEAQAGDVLVYDGRSVHGVDDVDPHLVPDLGSLRGRLVALTSLYKDMNGKAAEYQNYLARQDYADAD
ncbi:MAG: hypothetical protein Tsb0010_08600 [Parvularculaceae bacterium]